MTEVVVGPLRLRDDGPTSLTNATVRIAGRPHKWWIEHPSWVVPPTENPGDVLALPALFVAMRHRLPLVMRQPVSESLRENMSAVMDTYTSWFSDTLSPIEIVAETSPDASIPDRAAGRVAMCMTGGVDSLYSLLVGQHRPSILMNVLGVDIVTHTEIERDETRARIASIADATGTTAPPMRSNLRSEMIKRKLKWGVHAHGAVLASIARVLTEHADTLVIPSTHTYDTAIPWGSTPMADHLFSSHRLRVVHDDATYSRSAKIEAVGTHPLFREHARVCLRAGSDANCGECSKCLRTMVVLEAIDALSDSRRFPQSINLEILAGVRLAYGNSLVLMQDARSFLAVRKPGHPALGALDVVISESMASRPPLAVN